MCEITKCEDLIKCIERFDVVTKNLKDNHPSLHKKLELTLNEIKTFMTSSRAHLYHLYNGVDVAQDKADLVLDKLDTSELVLSFKTKKSGE